jgi:hypothetical protein
MKNIICPHCNQTHQAGARFCPVTGQTIPEQLTCANCGHGIQSDWIACPECGVSLAEDVAVSNINLEEKPPTKPKHKWLVGILLLGVVAMIGIMIGNVLWSFWLVDEINPTEFLTPVGTPAQQAVDRFRITLLESAPRFPDPIRYSLMAECEDQLESKCQIASDSTPPIKETQRYSFSLPGVPDVYPHWVTYVRSTIESQFDASTINQIKPTIFSTLDSYLQEAAEQIVRRQVDALSDLNVNNGALVAMRPSTGEILAMVGSADFYNAGIDGQVNMAISPRQPGSVIKPLIYSAAFEMGWTPATLIWDVPSEFPPSGRDDDPRPPYKPTNYDNRFRGPVTLRDALANSYNIPAVKVLDFVGIYDDPETGSAEGLITFAQRLGITTLRRDDYGLSLALGGGEVSLLELTGAYSVFANGGRLMMPYAITSIIDNNENIIFSYTPPTGEMVLLPEHAFFISSILSDNQARTPMFGANSVLNLPFTAAAMTGMTVDFRDTWTIGYTPDLVVGVWVGNSDYSPITSTGLTTAAPIWAEFMQIAIPYLTDGKPTPFKCPTDIQEICLCEISVIRPTSWCASQRSEIFATDLLPLEEDDLIQNVLVDTWTQLLASNDCTSFTKEAIGINVKDEWAKEWMLESDQFRVWWETSGFTEPVEFMPDQYCSKGAPRPLLGFSNLQPGDTFMDSTLSISGYADATQWFKSWRLEYGFGENPENWELLIQSEIPVKQAGEMHEWDLSDIHEGKLTLRLYMESTQGTYAEARLLLNVTR